MTVLIAAGCQRAPAGANNKLAPGQLEAQEPTATHATTESAAADTLEKIKSESKEKPDEVQTESFPVSSQEEKGKKLPESGQKTILDSAPAPVASDRTKENVEYAKKLGKDVVMPLDESAFLKANPKAKKNVEDSNPRAKVNAYDTLLETHAFMDGKLIMKGFRIPRTEEAFNADHKKVMESLGKPDSNLLDDDKKREGIIHSYAWRMNECDLLLSYTVKKSSKGFIQMFDIGSIMALDEVERRSKEMDESRSNADTLRLLETVLGKQGSVYRTRGWAEYSFGETKEKVEKVSPVTGKFPDKPDNPWLKLKNGTEVLFSPAGELVGIATTYSKDDNERSLEKLKDIFGVAEKTNIELFEVVDTFSRRREDILRLAYHFPEAVVVTQFVISTAELPNTTLKSERVLLTVFDRRWLAQELTASINAKRKTLNWFAEVVKAGRSGGFDKDKLPSYADAESEEKAPLAMDGVYWTAKAVKEPAKAAPTRAEKFPNPNWFAAIATQNARTPENPKGTVVCTLRFSRMANDGDGLIRRSVASFLVDRANSVLAQEYFRPRGDKIEVVTTKAKKTFEWMTKDYLTVRVQPDNSLVVIRKPD